MIFFSSSCSPLIFNILNLKQATLCHPQSLSYTPCDSRWARYVQERLLFSKYGIICTPACSMRNLHNTETLSCKVHEKHIT
ncbi:hypothetical protein EUGRSUZ_H01666 [Eucalyptus grandis]|uniref:Uncharacterized protein n=2 Tax=Eucalyptus grandis TaxID=71139 RepID=A0ACC3JSN7_EUCGR|nr:hypothetical protein EUGRSUZ_H01666 [Eucalyptus grandis]